MKSKGILYAVGAGVCWGASLGVFARSMTALGFSAMQIAAVRTTISALFFVFLALFTDREAFKIRLKDMWIFLCSGVISVTAFCYTYFTATQNCSLAVAEILSYTYPIWVIVLSSVVFHEKLTKDKLVAMLLAIVGCVLVSGITAGSGSVSTLGLVMGLLAGFTFGTYPIFTRFAIPHCRTMTISLYTFLVASASSILFAGPVETVSMVATPAVLPVALIGGVLCAALPYYLYTKAMDTLDNGMVSILATVEPVIATAISIVYYREPLQLSALIGILFILAAVILLAVKGQKQEKRSSSG